MCSCIRKPVRGQEFCRTVRCAAFFCGLYTEAGSHLMMDSCLFGQETLSWRSYVPEIDRKKHSFYNVLFLAPSLVS